MRAAEVVAEYNRVKAALVLGSLQGMIKVPRLRGADGGFTINALMLTFFSSHLGQIMTKMALITFLRRFKCDSLDPQPRHLGLQRGFDFLVGGCWHPGLQRTLRYGEFCLLSLTRAHPSAASMHRSHRMSCTTFDAIKRAYAHRCACCGSKEGEPHLKNAHLVTRLEKGHCDPRRPLLNNCIPMCGLCNMVYKNRAVFNTRGFIIKWLTTSSHHHPDADDNQEAAKPTAVVGLRVGRRRVTKPIAPAPAPAPLAATARRLRRGGGGRPTGPATTTAAAAPPAAAAAASATALGLLAQRRSARIAARLLLQGDVAVSG